MEKDFKALIKQYRDLGYREHRIYMKRGTIKNWHAQSDKLGRDMQSINKEFVTKFRALIPVADRKSFSLGNYNFTGSEQSILDAWKSESVESRIATIEDVTAASAGPKPGVIQALENLLRIKFKGPYSDGREYDAVAKSRGLLKLVTGVEMGQKLVKANWKETSASDIRDATCAFKQGKITVVLTVDVDGISVTAYAASSKDFGI